MVLADFHPGDRVMVVKEENWGNRQRLVRKTGVVVKTLNCHEDGVVMVNMDDRRYRQQTFYPSQLSILAPCNIPDTGEFTLLPDTVTDVDFRPGDKVRVLKDPLIFLIGQRGTIQGLRIINTEILVDVKMDDPRLPLRNFYPEQLERVRE